MRVLIDTSIIIDYTRSGRGPLKELIEKNRELSLELFTSSIIISELWAGKSMSSHKEVILVEKLLEPFDIVEFNSEMAKISGKLRRDRKAEGFDSLIAATAIYLGAHVATQNAKHFEKVPGLKLFKLQKK